MMIKNTHLQVQKLGLGVLFFCSSLCAFSQGQRREEKKGYAEFRAVVFANHLKTELELRQPLIERCSKRNQSAQIVEYLEKLRGISKLGLSGQSFTIHLLELMDQGEELKSLCPEMMKASLQLENDQRARFNRMKQAALKTCVGMKDCKDIAQYLIDDIDPYCVRVVQKDFNGYLDTNPCMASSKRVEQNLKLFQRQRQLSLNDDLDLLLARFSQKIAKGENADLWEIYRTQGNAWKGVMLREQFLSAMTLLAYSGTSELGYMDWSTTFVWKESVRQGFSAEAIMEQIHKHKYRIDIARDLMNWARQKNLKVYFAGHDVGSWNRHNYVAAFLACHYHNSGYERTEALLIPRILGHAYESLDFLSHRKGAEYLNLKSSMNEFKADTGRYIQSSAWGFDFCRQGRFN